MLLAWSSRTLQTNSQFLLQLSYTIGSLLTFYPPIRVRNVAKIVFLFIVVLDLLGWKNCSMKSWWIIRYVCLKQFPSGTFQCLQFYMDKSWKTSSTRPSYRQQVSLIGIDFDFKQRAAMWCLSHPRIIWDKLYGFLLFRPELHHVYLILQQPKKKKKTVTCNFNRRKLWFYLGTSTTFSSVLLRILFQCL